MYMSIPCRFGYDILELQTDGEDVRMTILKMEEFDSETYLSKSEATELYEYLGEWLAEF